jgi:hypothetical protein
MEQENNCLITEVTTDIQREHPYSFYQYETHNVKCGAEMRGSYSIVAFNMDMIDVMAVIGLFLMFGYLIIRDRILKIKR